MSPRMLSSVALVVGVALSTFGIVDVIRSGVRRGFYDPDDYKWGVISAVLVVYSIAVFKLARRSHDA